MRKVKFKVVREIGERRVSAFAAGNYSLDYPKNSIVRTIEGTLGVAVFGRRSEAEKFCERRLFLEIVRVLPIGRGRTVKKVSRHQNDSALDVFYGSKEKNSIYYDFAPMSPPLGTMFYPAVKVIE